MHPLADGSVVDESAQAAGSAVVAVALHGEYWTAVPVCGSR